MIDGRGANSGSSTASASRTYPDRSGIDAMPGSLEADGVLVPAPRPSGRASARNVGAERRLACDRKRRARLGTSARRARVGGIAGQSGTDCSRSRLPERPPSPDGPRRSRPAGEGWSGRAVRTGCGAPHENVIEPLKVSSAMALRTAATLTASDSVGCANVVASTASSLPWSTWSGIVRLASMSPPCCATIVAPSSSAGTVEHDLHEPLRLAHGARLAELADELRLRVDVVAAVAGVASVMPTPATSGSVNVTRGIAS